VSGSREVLTSLCKESVPGNHAGELTDKADPVWVRGREVKMNLATLYFPCNKSFTFLRAAMKRSISSGVL